MNRVEQLLRHLQDGRWHKKVPKEIGIGIWQACKHLKLVKEKLLPAKEGRSHVRLQITLKGKQMLKTGKYPTREKLTEVIHCTTYTTTFCRKH